jgi:hypothetical protein
VSNFVATKTFIDILKKNFLLGVEKLKRPTKKKRKTFKNLCYAQKILLNSQQVINWFDNK